MQPTGLIFIYERKPISFYSKNSFASLKRLFNQPHRHSNIINMYKLLFALLPFSSWRSLRSKSFVFFFSAISERSILLSFLAKNVDCSIKPYKINNNIVVSFLLFCFSLCRRKPLRISSIRLTSNAVVLCNCMLCAVNALHTQHNHGIYISRR